MRARFPPSDDSCAGSGAQLERRARVLGGQHLYGDAHVHDHVGAGLGLWHEPECDRASVVEPAYACPCVIPNGVEDVNRSEAHQSGTSSSTVSNTTPAASGAVASSQSVASIVAPSARVPRAASSKCSRKCSAVKCESAPSRTWT